MQIMTDSTLKHLRQELGITQEDLAIRARVRINTYRNAERGGNVSYTTAQSILGALNAIRMEHNMPLFDLKDLGLNIV